MNSISNSNNELQQSYSERTITISDYLRVVFRRKWIIVISFVAVFGSTAYYTFTSNPIYQASTTIMINEDQGMQKALFSFSTLSRQTTMINNQVELLKSRNLAEQVVLKLLEDPKRDSLEIIHNVIQQYSPSFYQAVGRLRANLTVSPLRETEFIKIQVKGSSPFEAAYLTNAIAKVYQNQDKEFSQGEISQIVNFLDNQLKKKEKELKASEEGLKHFQENEGISFLSEEAQQLVNQVSQFETLYQTALTDMQTAETRLNYLKNQLGERKQNLEKNVSSISSPLINKLREQLAGYERDIAVLMSQGVGEDYPDVMRLRAEQQKIKERLVEETQTLLLQGLNLEDPLRQAQEVVEKILIEETEYTSLKARVAALKKIVNAFNEKLDQLPDKTLRLARLERNRKVDENLYIMMKEKYEESRITQAGLIGKIRIVDTAMEPKDPILPRTKLNLILGTLLGMGLGVGIAFLMEYMDNSVRTIEEAESLGLPVLGSIPTIKPDQRNGFILTNDKKSSDIQSKLVTHIKPKSPISEAYRSLRTNIQFAESLKPIQTILITSSGPGEGKSTTVSNLAITLAQFGGKILVVDTDLRRPIIHRMFEADKQKGLTNYLVGKLSFDELIQPTEIENLDVITCGTLPPNPSEILGSTNMKKLIEKLKSIYQFIVFDSPPVIAVTDAAVLATELDGVILVVESGNTQRDLVLRSNATITNVKARLMGILLNNMSVSNMYGSYYYYYYYHYYYGDDGEKTKESNKHKKRSRFVS